MGRDDADCGGAGPEKPAHGRRGHHWPSRPLVTGLAAVIAQSAPTVDDEVAGRARDHARLGAGLLAGGRRRRPGPRAPDRRGDRGAATMGARARSRLSRARPRHRGGHPQPNRRRAVVGNGRPSALATGGSPSSGSRASPQSSRSPGPSSSGLSACSRGGSSRSPRSARWCSIGAPSGRSRRPCARPRCWSPRAARVGTAAGGAGNGAGARRARSARRRRART